MVLQKPNLDGKKPRHLHVGHEDVLSAGAVIFDPTSRAVVMDEQLTTLRPSLGICGSAFVPSHFEHVAGWRIDSGAKEIVVQYNSFHYRPITCVQISFRQHVSVYLGPW